MHPLAIPITLVRVLPYSPHAGFQEEISGAMFISVPYTGFHLTQLSEIGSG
jgi:hypothetical protein